MIQYLMAAQSISSAYADSVSLAEQDKFQKQQAEFNSKLLDIKSKEAIKQGSEQADLFSKKAAKVVASQKVAAAASGVVVNFGSAQDVQDETRLMSAMDTERIKNNAMLEAWGYKVKKSELLTQSNFDSMASKNKQNNTLLGGAAKASVYAYSGKYADKDKTTDTTLDFFGDN